MISSDWQSRRPARSHMKATNVIKDGASDGLPVRHIDAFLNHLRTARYAEYTLCKKRWDAVDEEPEYCSGSSGRIDYDCFRAALDRPACKREPK